MFGTLLHASMKSVYVGGFVIFLRLLSHLCISYVWNQELSLYAERWERKTVWHNSQTNSLICSGQELSLPCMGFLCLFTSCKNTPFEEAYDQSTYYYTKWPKRKMYTQNFIFFPFISSLIFSPLCKCVEDKCLKVIINWNWEKRPENILGKYRNLKW